MKRIYEPYAYGDGPVANCFWAETLPMPELATLNGDLQTEVLIIGAGFSGLSAALHLAKAGVDVTVIDAEHPYWGASGRNGGFCCLGGSKASNRHLTRRYGSDGRIAYRRAERTAVELAQSLIEAYAIDVDRHSDGEVILAHRPKDAPDLQGMVAEIAEDYGVKPTFLTKGDLAARGMNGPFYGGLHTPIGFALNPRKYADGLLTAALHKGARVFAHTAAMAINRTPNGYRVPTKNGSIIAQKVIIATNGYSAEDVPKWLRARFMPVQSSVLVTRPLSKQEQANAGWTSDLMAYNTRNLLHYFRKLPDDRFLFGMRGGLFATDRSRRSISGLLRAEFHTMFPAWANVEISHEWSGLVSLSRSMMPYVGPVPEMPNVFAALSYHGNGVAMGTYAGSQIAQLVRGEQTTLPDAMRTIPKRFWLGSKRRWLMLPVYLALGLADR